MTWNLQGSQGVDIDAVASVVRRAAPDVVALQEVQRRQARRLATALSIRSPRRAWIWAWQRRVAVDVTVATDGGPLRVIDVHLSPHDHGPQRRRESGIILARARRGAPAPLVLGDLNEPPGGGAIGELLAAGWRDAWSIADADEDDGATNWTAGARRGRAPTQRIDYVLVPPGARVQSAVVIRGVGAAADTDAMAELSDHLPLVVTIAQPVEERS
jgi:endonuclease/exonuclease/phosphatase family metal-dependent hydrolase